LQDYERSMIEGFSGQLPNSHCSRTARAIITARVPNRRRGRTCLLRIVRQRLTRVALTIDCRRFDENGDCGAGGEAEGAVAKN
jgi:hypothetical protein